MPRRMGSACYPAGTTVCGQGTVGAARGLVPLEELTRSCPH